MSTTPPEYCPGCASEQPGTACKLCGWTLKDDPSRATPILCEHGCGRVQQGNASDYYHVKDCRARQIRVQIDAATDTDELAQLLHELGPALLASRYVGD